MNIYLLSWDLQGRPTVVKHSTLKSLNSVNDTSIFKSGKFWLSIFFCQAQPVSSILFSFIPLIENILQFFRYYEVLRRNLSELHRKLA